MKTMDELSAQLKEQHRQGLLAIHMTGLPDQFYDKMDDRRIINNLREDGGAKPECGLINRGRNRHRASSIRPRLAIQ